MNLTLPETESPDLINQLLRVREVECEMCGAKDTAMLEQLERKGWLVTNNFTLCPKDRF
jgi:hypothetical protein